MEINGSLPSARYRAIFVHRAPRHLAPCTVASTGPPAPADGPTYLTVAILHFKCKIANPLTLIHKCRGFCIGTKREHLFISTYTLYPQPE